MPAAVLAELVLLVLPLLLPLLRTTNHDPATLAPPGASTHSINLLGIITLNPPPSFLPIPSSCPLFSWSHSSQPPPPAVWWCLGLTHVSTPPPFPSFLTAPTHPSLLLFPVPLFSDVLGVAVAAQIPSYRCRFSLPQLRRSGHCSPPHY